RTDETHDQARFEAEVPQERRVGARGIEVGHIFYFGTKYSQPMNALVARADGSKVAVEMGSYGIGVSRLVAAIIEASHDERGIVWPVSVAPYGVGLANLKQGDAAADAACEGLYEGLSRAGIEVLYDDRDERAGAKFATMDLIGLPWRVTVGPRGLASGKVELTERRTGASEELPPEAALNRLAALFASR
ncbi:MAG TPA: His/Gly/Thr/Pro-type tRNA ligase C-terminal domain-containing protein, partial [Paracoccaceae bacterium]|nr:His/Gly/Thr/Pro-type tRNA ligase C-terminal domain-containing protein [Paracoccaceae bacterium]